jgi:CheY-like chemotaxis protein
MPVPTRTKVLVADDEKLIADTLALILNGEGFEARAVYSGDQVLAITESFEPDFLITDVMMPDLNGIEAAIIVRAKLPACRVLLFSGQAATGDLLANARAQNHEFETLAKPVHPVELLAKIRSMEMLESALEL